MLVLDRKLHEGIWIGNVFVKVPSIGRNRVKIGIAAPREVLVIREELVNRAEGDSVEERTG